MILTILVLWTIISFLVIGLASINYNPREKMSVALESILAVVCLPALIVILVVRVFI